MENKKSFIIHMAALVAFIAVAVIGYNFLIKNYKPDSADNTSDVKLEMASDFTVVNAMNEQVSLSDNIGKPIVVNFWATWCGPCTSELPHFQTMYNKYKDKVTFMMVNMTDGYQEKMSDVKPFLTKNGYTFPVYYDTNYSASYAYSVNSIPMTLFINAEGEIVNTYLGAMNEETLESYIKDLFPVE